MAIKHLPETLINQIAAGEVIERPASAAKELIENAIDAGATRIEVATAGGGLALLRITDNGCGMGADDLELAVQRHCTSKLDNGLQAISTLGFRGEALPSIGSVARLAITSRRADADQGAEIQVHGGKVSPVRPKAANPGTIVEVSDLFFATPARLKFMKSEKAEAGAITEVVRRMAIAFPGIRFTLSGSDRTTLEFPRTGDDKLARITQVLGKELEENAIAIDAEREGVTLSGFACIPAYHRSNSLQQYFFVNGRPVSDKLLFSALRGAYAEAMPAGRYPVAVLDITLDPALVDVNVHPAKSDVRFRDPGLVRGLIVGGIREALARGGGRSSARETAARVAAGGLARKVVPGLVVRGALVQIGIHKINRDNWDWAEVDRNPFFSPDPEIVPVWEEYLSGIRKNGSSVGAVVEIVAENVPAGIGAPIYGKLDQDIAANLMSINAVKGVEIGNGFHAAEITGEENADEMRIGPDGKPVFLSNHAGGILGGISTGQPVIARFAVKPTSSILTERRSIDADGNEVDIRTKGRHDPCVGIRAVPVGEAMVACAIADHYLRDRGQTGRLK